MAYMKKYDMNIILVRDMNITLSSREIYFSHIHMNNEGYFSVNHHLV